MHQILAPLEKLMFVVPLKTFVAILHCLTDIVVLSLILRVPSDSRHKPEMETSTAINFLTADIGTEKETRKGGKRCA